MVGRGKIMDEALRGFRKIQGGGGPGGGPQVPKGVGGVAVGAATLAAGVFVFSKSLFNVDGGQRAIKYKRISGVSKEIYNEGRPPAAPGGEAPSAGQPS